MMDELKTLVGNAFAVAVLGMALVFVFGAPVLHGLVDFARAMGAN